MLQGQLCPLPALRPLGAERSKGPENNPNPPGACGGFRPTHHPPHHAACSLGAAAPGSRRSSGAVLRPSALTATRRFSSSRSGSATPGAALALGNRLVGFVSSTSLKFQAVPFQVGYFPLKGFHTRALRPTYPMPLHSNSQIPTHHVMTAFFHFSHIHVLMHL